MAHSGLFEQARRSMSFGSPNKATLRDDSRCGRVLGARVRLGFFQHASLRKDSGVHGWYYINPDPPPVAHYSFGRLVQGLLGLTIPAMSCIIRHEPGMLAPVFNSTTMVIPSAGR